MSPRRLDPEDQRARIISAVCSVVAAQGYTKATVAEISHAAGVSTRTFYELYEDRHAAYDDALRRVGTVLIAEVEQACQRSASFPEVVVNCLRVLLVHVVENRAAAEVCLVDIFAAQPKSIARRDVALGALAAGLERRASLDPHVQRPTAMAAELAIGGVANVVYDCLISGRAEELPGMLPDLAFSILAVYMNLDVAVSHTTTLAGPPSSPVARASRSEVPSES